jgi:NET1-associated nuclear protein 1 (U3 small nucleolar RNA-associated protein 17)
MTVASMVSADRRRDVVFTTEVKKDGGWRITANELATPGGPIETVARTIYTSNNHIRYLKTAKEGSVICGAAGSKVVLGRLRSTEYDTLDKIRYEFRVLDSTEIVTSLDLKVSEAIAEPNAKRTSKQIPVVDLVVGGARGAIFVHSNLLTNLVNAQAGKLPPGASMTPRRLHWHRQAVHTVKWSLDGIYY